MTNWRKLVADRCGGEKFDELGGGYAFSAVLAEERRLQEDNIPGQPETALLKLSIADPTSKMHEKAMEEAMNYYRNCLDATRYTDLAGIRENNGTKLGDTHTELINTEQLKMILIPADGSALDWIQYSPGAIKRALAEFIPATFFQKERRDDLLVFPTPGYPVIKNPRNKRGIEVQDLPMVLTDKGWRIPLEKIETGGDRNIFLYFNNPHNPTGAAYSRDELYYLVNWAICNNVTIIVDEAYILLVYGLATSILSIPDWHRCSIVVQSISKGWSATGFRFGWIVADPIAIKALRGTIDVKDSGLPGPIIAAAITCLRNPQWARETNQRYLTLHKILAKGLKKAGFGGQIPDAGLCQFTKAPRSVDGYEFETLESCVRWFRKVLRISLMHYEVEGRWYLRWAVTLKPVPECGLPTEELVLAEVSRRLQGAKFTF